VRASGVQKQNSMMDLVKEVLGHCERGKGTSALPDPDCSLHKVDLLPVL